MKRSARAVDRSGVLARHVLPGRTYLLTRRCSERRFFLRPSAELNAIFEYALARAVSMTGMKVHGWVVMSNHIHIVATDTYAERPRFMALLNTEVAKAGSALIGRWDGFWEPGRSYSAVELLDAKAVVEKLAYTWANPVSSRLVRRARRWPGSTSARRRFGDTVVAQRPKGGYYASSVQPESYAFELEAPPNMDALECDRLVRAQVRRLEKETEDALRGAGSKFLGEKRVLRQNPNDSPTTWEKRRGRNPTFASRDKWARIEAAQRNTEWLAAYAEALDTLRGGFKDVLFPVGTWLMVRRYGFGCEPMRA